MYADPSQIRKHVFKIALNDAEAALVDAIVNYTGQQRQPLLRDLLLEQIRLVMTGEGDIALPASRSEGPRRAGMQA